MTWEDKKIRCWFKSNSANRIWIRKLKNSDGENIDSTQSMFVLTMLEKIKEMKQKFSKGSITIL